MAVSYSAVYALIIGVEFENKSIAPAFGCKFKIDGRKST
jgi:hypothetical protein